MFVDLVERCAASVSITAACLFDAAQCMRVVPDLSGSSAESHQRFDGIRVSVSRCDVNSRATVGRIGAVDEIGMLTGDHRQLAGPAASS